MNLTDFELGWLIGIIEGEGTIFVERYGYPRIKVSMTDKDTIIKVASLLQSSMVKDDWHKRHYPQKQIQWKTSISGVKAAKWIRLIYPFMSKRRQKQIEKALKKYKPIELKLKNQMKLVRKIRSLYKTGLYTQKELSTKFNIGRTTMSRIIRHERWAEC